MSHTLNGVMGSSVAFGHASLSYLKSGLISDKDLLFIHGWGGSAQYFDDVMRDLSDGRMCYAPDLPGFGHSTPILPSLANTVNRYGEMPYSHRGLARTLGEFMDAMGIDVCDVIGHSYGCGVAIALAALFPQRISRVIISNFSTFRDERERRTVSFMHHVTGLMMLARRLPFARTDGFARVFGARYFHHLPEDTQVLRDGLGDFMQMNDEAARLTVRDSLGWETPQDLAKLTQPVLSIHCRQDRIMPPRNAAFTANMAPHGQLAWIDQCGHMPMIEQRSEWVRLVRNFLNL